MSLGTCAWNLPNALPGRIVTLRAPNREIRLNRASKELDS